MDNDEDADIGTNLETDAELRARFAASHAMTNSGILDAFVTGLLSVSGVKFAEIVENDSGTTDANGLPAHSFCAVVDGGSDDDVAGKILYLKPPGVATYGNTTIVVEDDQGSHTINFSRPVTSTVPITITVKNLGGYDASRIDGIIKASIMEDVNALGIGKSWALTMGYRDIYTQFSSGAMPFAVVSIESEEADENGIVECDYDHVLVTDENSIEIVVVE